MKRLIYNKLLKWKNRANRKPLIIDGARQVGKTWIHKEFGRAEYKNVAYINCDKVVEMKSLFYDFDVKRLIRVSVPFPVSILFRVIQSSFLMKYRRLLLELLR